MWGNAIHATVFAVIAALALPAAAENRHGQGGAFLVPTFHCIGIYWSPAEGGAKHQVLVSYRRKGQQRWRTGLPLRYHPIDTPECKADYRGSLVNLTPGTIYEIALTLGETGRRTECRGTTWSEEFPVKSVEKVSDRDTTLTVDKSGRPGSGKRRTSPCVFEAVVSPHARICANSGGRFGRVFGGVV